MGTDPGTFRDALGDDAPRPSRPNVVVVLLDDVGFAQFSCFGSEIETPAIDKLAAGGLRYNRFHVTSICSASRAALITGRNHHAVNMGAVADASTDTPGYTGRLPKSAATMQRIMTDDGYNTFAVGKWHLTPNGERSHAGPFTQWPLGTGFERYYGFLRADANQWVPNLVEDNHSVDPPATPAEGYHLTEDLADRAINMLLDQHHTAPDKPFFMYFAPGAMHAPHQVAQPWIDQYAGKFDDGWEAMRQRIYDRQVAAGVIPEGTELSERPSWIPDWSDLDEADRRLYARMHEVYAGFMSHTDAQIGRIADFLDDIGELDNTLFIVTSDNGASAEGGEIGAVNEHNFTLRIAEERAANHDAIDSWGGERGYYHYAWGWAWAGNTPLRLWKRYAWLGGTRTPMVMHWPAGIQARGEVRPQLCHIVDLMPTILDVCGIDAPISVDGVEQQPIDGASIAATFNDATAANPRDHQYFEMMGSRGMISNEWKATTNHVMPLMLDEQRLLEGSHDYADDEWHLFHLPTDFAESHDVAAENPEVLARIQGEWMAEAERNNVFPLLGGYDPRPGAPVAAPRGSAAFADPNPHKRRVLRPGGSPITDESLPKLGAGGTVTAFIEAGSGQNGVLCAMGDWTQGWVLYLDHGTLMCCMNVAGDETWASSASTIGSDATQLGFQVVVRDRTDFEVHVLVDGESVGSGRGSRPIPVGMQQVGGTGLCIGYDRGFPVSDRYETPNTFDGTIRYVVMDAQPGQPTPYSELVARALHED